MNAQALLEPEPKSITDFPPVVVPYIPYYPTGFFVWFEIDEDLTYRPMPVKRIPFPRKSIGYHVHFVVHPKKPDPAPVDTHHAILVVGLAAKIHGTALAVRKAAWRMLRRVESVRSEAIDPLDGVSKVFASGAEIMDLIMYHREPVRFVELIVQETRLKQYAEKKPPQAAKSGRRVRSSKRSRKK